MINAADYLHEEDSLTTLQSSFCHAKESKVGLVQVAINFKITLNRNLWQSF